jgi:hypothetical protein
MDVFTTEGKDVKKMKEEQHDKDLLIGKMEKEQMKTKSDFNMEKHLMTIKGIEGCTKCGGKGMLESKKEKGKMKACKECLIANGMCVKCHNTGFRLDDPDRACKCKEKGIDKQKEKHEKRKDDKKAGVKKEKKDKKDKKDEKEKKDKH